MFHRARAHTHEKKHNGRRSTREGEAANERTNNDQRPKSSKTAGQREEGRGERAEEEEWETRAHSGAGGHTTHAATRDLWVMRKPKERRSPHCGPKRGLKKEYDMLRGGLCVRENPAGARCVVRGVGRGQFTPPHPSATTTRAVPRSHRRPRSVGHDEKHGNNFRIASQETTSAGGNPPDGLGTRKTP